jgi:hypothetical protein
LRSILEQAVESGAKSQIFKTHRFFCQWLLKHLQREGGLLGSGQTLEKI